MPGCCSKSHAFLLQVPQAGGNAQQHLHHLLRAAAGQLQIVNDHRQLRNGVFGRGRATAARHLGNRDQYVGAVHGAGLGVVGGNVSVTDGTGHAIAETY